MGESVGYASNASASNFAHNQSSSALTVRAQPPDFGKRVQELGAFAG